MTGERDPEVEQDEGLVERVREERNREDKRIKREKDREELNEHQTEEDGRSAFARDRAAATNLAERPPSS